jgi:hypothetical protein
VRPPPPAGPLPPTISVRAPYLDPSHSISKPTEIMSMTRSTDGTLLVLTASEDGPQILTMAQMRAVGTDLLFQYFENHLGVGRAIDQAELLGQTGGRSK